MPNKPLQPCRRVGCRELVRAGYCEAHARTIPPRPSPAPTSRPSAARRGYGRQWQRASQSFLRRNPICIECARHGEVRLADQVDHVVPHRGDMDLFWDVNNWQPLCKGCHSRKTARGE